MDEFLRQVCAEFGLAEDVARQGTAVVFRHLVFRADRRDVRAICDGVPGLARIAAAAERKVDEGRRGLAVEPVDPTVGLRASLDKAGIEDTVKGPFVDRLIEFLRGSAGAAIVDRHVAAADELRALVERAGA